MTTLEINGDVVAEDIIPFVMVTNPIRRRIRSVTGGCGGFVARPPDIRIDVDFRGEEPERIKMIALRHFLINEMTIRSGGGSARFRYCLVDRIDHIDDITRVSFVALRVEYDRGTGFASATHNWNKPRVCNDCKDNFISFGLIQEKMHEVGFTSEVIEKMWNDDTFEFLCCTCHAKSEDKPLEWVRV